MDRRGDISFSLKNFLVTVIMTYVRHADKYHQDSKTAYDFIIWWFCLSFVWLM